MAKIIITESDIKNLVLPDGWELIEVKTKAEKIKDLEDKIPALEEQQEPDNQELLDMGRTVHPYYLDQETLGYIKDELKKLKE